MSRSVYDEDCHGRELDLYRGAVASAIRGRRGQAFLRELLAALDALRAPRLIYDRLEDEAGEVCALGAVGRARGMDLDDIDAEDSVDVAFCFKIANALAAEVAWINDEAGDCTETPEQRFARVRRWVVRKIHPPEQGAT